ncbi:hypothetical protein [Nioella sp. MMSF_3534]|jgi:hypothetical protein|uniref:hypothetical protein n=1 Tax=Nioella sp. MMSF_3534 TaxID=3046720 RepID=UPI00273F9313|nr:hypothetical protein [Nioella sp. MMSF_3534]
MAFIPFTSPAKGVYPHVRTLLRALDSSTTMLWAIALLAVAWIAGTIVFGYAGLIIGALTAVVLGFYLLIRITLG